jgi:hypothetical protein
MKPLRTIGMTDGTFLRYVVSTGGEKTSETSIVFHEENGPDGYPLYCIYSINSSMNNGYQAKTNYKNWPSYTLIDPKRASVLESIQNFNQVSNNTLNGSFPLVVSTYFKYNPANGLITSSLKSSKKGVLSESTYHSMVNPLFPVFDNISLYYILGFLDIRGGGTVYMSVPALFKDALPCTFKYISEEKLHVGAGDFQAYKVYWMLSDLFLTGLLQPLMKDARFYVDSKTGIMLIGEGAGSKSELIEISNIKLR